MTICKGDRVAIKPEFQDAGDDSIVWVAVDDESKGRVTIEAQLGFGMNPTQVVAVDMLESA